MAATSASSPTTATSCATGWSGRTAGRSRRCGSTSGWPPRSASRVRPRTWPAGRVELANHQHFSDLGWLRASYSLTVDGERGRRRRVRPAGARTRRAGDGRPSPAGWRRSADDGRGVPDGPHHDRRRPALGAGRLRGLRAAAADRRRRQRAAAAPPRRPIRAARSRSTPTAASSTRCWRPPRPCRCGGPRPTTTGSAGWRRAGRRSASTGSSADSSASIGQAPATVVRDRVRDRRRDRRSRTRPPTPCLADGGIAVDETADIPDELTDLARVGTVLEVVPGPEDAALVRVGAARDLPGSQARRPGRHAGGRPSPDQYVPYIRPQENGGHADVRWLELTDAAGAGLRIDLDEPRQVSVTHLRAADLAAATHDIDVVPVAETVVHLDAAHRGLGTASCGPGHPARVPARGRHATAGPGPCATSDRADRCRSPGRADGREFHLRNDLISYVMRVHDERLARPSAISAPRSPPTGRSATSRPPAFEGFANRVGDPVALEYPTTGSGDYRVPGPDRRAGRRLGRPRARLRRAPDPCRQARPSAGGRPPGDLRRVRRGGRNARDRARRRASAASPSSSSYTIFGDRPVVARSARIRNDGAAAGPADRRDERDARPARRALGARPAQRGMGAREPRHHERRCARAASRSAATAGRSSAMHNPFIALRRATTTEADGEVYRLQPRLLGQLHRRGRGRPVRHDPGPDRHQPEHLQLDARAGRVVRHARRRSSSTRRPGSAAMSDALHGLYRERLARGTWRDAPRPVLINNWEATYFGFDEAKLLEIATLGARPRRRAVRARRRLVRRARFGRLVARRLVRRPAQAARRPRRARREGRGARPPVRALDRARDGQPAEPAVRGAPGLGGRRPGPAADREPPAARPRHVAARRSSTTSFGVLSEVLASAPISYVKWDMNRTITEPFSAGPPGRPSGRVLPPLRARRLRPVRPAHGGLPGHPVRVVRQRRRPVRPGHAGLRAAGLDERRHRRDRAPADPVGDLAGLSAELDGRPRRRRSRTTRPAGSRRSPRAPRSRSSASSATSSTRRSLDPEERAAVAEQIAFYKAHRELFQRGRFVRLRSPFEGDGNQTAWWSSRPMRRAPWSATTCRSTGPCRPADRLRLRGLDPAATYRVTGWPADDGDAARSGPTPACAAATS